MTQPRLSLPPSRQQEPPRSPFVGKLESPYVPHPRAAAAPSPMLLARGAAPSPAVLQRQQQMQAGFGGGGGGQMVLLQGVSGDLAQAPSLPQFGFPVRHNPIKP